jgi:hypothetical protein
MVHKIFSSSFIETVSILAVKNAVFGCYAAWLLQDPTFQRNVSPPESGWQESVS